MDEPTNQPGVGDGSEQLALRDAERVIDALNQVLEEDATPHDKARMLLRAYQRLLGSDYDVQLMLCNELDRPAAPLVMDRVTLGPTFDRIEPRTTEEVQANVDSTFPFSKMILDDTLANIRTPRVFVLTQDLLPEHQQWLSEEFLPQQLEPRGWCDTMIGCWASGPDRMVIVVVYRRRENPPFDGESRRLGSLMLRAAAPVIYREMFEGALREDEPASPLKGRDLSDRQREVLMLLLKGHSEKEVARDLGVSTHTVHTHVKRLYEVFEVSSRGELLANFIDRRILAEAGA